jgi:predicted ATP-binding protein involved in virulence
VVHLAISANNSQFGQGEASKHRCKGGFMIRVKQLHLENVGPFAAQDLDFSVQEGHPDIHILTGINGTGKTTILHAIAAMFDHFEESIQHREYASNAFNKRFRFSALDDNGSPKSNVQLLVSVPDAINGPFLKNIICWRCVECGNLHREDHFWRKSGFKVNRMPSQIEDHWDSPSLNDYFRAAPLSDISKKPLAFAAFGYSGYRLISSAQVQLGTEDKFNPLHQALEFVKKQDSSSGIANWIVSRHAKAAIEESLGNKETAKRYREALDTLLKNIEALTDNQYRFEIQTNPWKVAIKYFDKDVEFDVLPDGLRSVLSWMGDLLMRLDNISWVDNHIPVNEQYIVLLLDEIEVHLHPKWQYQILPLTQKLFPNAQIFITTHSPFILNSIDNAKIYKLKTELGEASLDGVVLSETGNSYSYVFENILQTHNTFGYATMELLKNFNILDREIASLDFSHEAEFKDTIAQLQRDGEEVTDMIASKLARLKRITGKDYFHGENHEKAAV